MKGSMIQDIEGREDVSLEIRNFLQTGYRDGLIRDIREGLSQYQKTIPCKYLYDDYGCRLFDLICCTPEYYLTQKESAILDRSGADIMQFFVRKGGDLVELGSGANKKIKKLLDATAPDNLPNIRYVPVDISAYTIRESSVELISLYEDIKILGVVTDFTRRLDILPTGRKMIIFFGSTIGNFSEEEAISFLKKIRGIMSQDDRFLLGLDMLKPVEVIEAAYNDGMGLTERFNRNILAHINRELNADFPVHDFAHLAFFNKEKERIEMHLEAKRSVRVRISDLALTVEFKKGETLHTEIAGKFSRDRARNIFKNAGLKETAWFTDPKEWFSLVMLKPGSTKGEPETRGW